MKILKYEKRPPNIVHSDVNELMEAVVGYLVACDREGAPACIEARWELVRVVSKLTEKAERNG